MSAVGKFFTRSHRDRALFFEALLALVCAKVLVHTVPFRRVAPRLGRAQHETTRAISAAERVLAVDVSWAVQCAARYVPLGFVCLPQAMAAQTLLRRRGVATTLYLGVAPKLEKAQGITAHAWLRAGDKIVTGESEAANHRELARFGDEPTR